jgi:NAD(P)H-quinone oxidoreductase subunit 5
MYFSRSLELNRSRVAFNRSGDDPLMPSDLTPLVAPAIVSLAAAIAFLDPGQQRSKSLPKLVEAAALLALAAAIGSACLLLFQGAGTSALLGLGGIGLSARLDAVSAIMLVLVAFVGWIVVRYSASYLDGEARQGAFLGWMAATLAAVLLLVQAGNLVHLAFVWIATSMCLHRLLLFYRGRVQAIRAGRKKFVVARIGDVALIAAAALLAQGYGTLDIGEILAVAGEGVAPAGTPWAAGMLALAAVLKSAQFPTHGWLTEVMETPTPVSALLHAGVINAGGFLLIRFADVMLLAPGVLAVLVMIGGFTAVLGGLAMLAQPAVKTSLAWSTIAQMGFMIMQCGLALFPLALLHIVAHSLYKAHAFLASGTAVERVAAIRRPGPIAIPDGWAVTRAFALALTIYVAIGLAFGFEAKSPQAIALGAILIFGVAYLLAQGLADAAPKALTRRTALCSVAASVSYFALQTVAEWLTAGTLPATPAPGPLEWAMLALALVSFALVAIAQAMFPLWAYHPAAAGLRVHLSNGLYANALFDRIVRNWSVRSSA